MAAHGAPPPTDPGWRAVHVGASEGAKTVRGVGGVVVGHGAPHSPALVRRAPFWPDIWWASLAHAGLEMLCTNRPGFPCQTKHSEFARPPRQL